MGSMGDILIEEIKADKYLEQFKNLYGSNIDVLRAQKRRYCKAIETFTNLYGEGTEVELFSAPGRSEVCGNHTDHQNGKVLAAAVNLDAIAVVHFHDRAEIRLKSEGYDEITVDLQDLSIHEEEKGSTKALIRGVAACFAKRGVRVSGFDAYVTSEVLSGSGLSSSAAFENLIGTIIDIHDNQGQAGAVEIAKFGQIAENEFFGKQSGLMDQMVSSVGGFVSIDFEDTQSPVIEKIDIHFEEAGLCLVITDTKGSHADLTDDYVDVRMEMKQVAEYFGKEVLREVDEREFYERIPDMRKHGISDRAILRASHCIEENKRVEQAVTSLKEKSFTEFLDVINRSGTSSYELLQNVYSNHKPQNQEIPLALMMSKRVLRGQGACRVHGGGFAGTIQAFVPEELTEAYISVMSGIYGEDACYVLNIRNIGGCRVI